jgi:hypothetical protein
MVFITGDVSDGSKNDLLLRDIIGPNWKVLTGAEQPILQQTVPASSPGYCHAKFWPSFMKRVELIQEKEKLAMASKPKLENSIVNGEKNTSVGVKINTSVNFNLVDPVYTSEEDLKRVTYQSAVDLKRHTSAPAQSTLSHVVFEKHDDGIVFSSFLTMLENIQFFFEDIYLFRNYLIQLLETLFGTSTRATVIFMRISLLFFLLTQGKYNTKVGGSFGLLICVFVFLYFAMHDLRYSKKALKALCEKHSIS